MTTKKIYFVRHGETEGNAGGFFQFPDTPLTEQGKRGAKALAERFDTIKIDIIVSSPFFRAQQTAAPISEKKNIPVTLFEAFHEFNQATAIRGVLLESEEGQKYRAQYKANFTDSAWKPEGVENYYDVIERVEACVVYLESLEQENILVVSHGSFLRLLIAYILLGKQNDVATVMTVDKSFLRMSNVGITEFVITDGRWRLFTWNDHAHFAE